MDLSDSNLSDMKLVDKLSKNLSNLNVLNLKNRNLLGQFLDNLLNSDNLLWLSWSDDKGLWSNLGVSDVSDDLSDNLSDDGDLLLDDSDLLLKDGDLLLEDWLLWSWSLLNLGSDDVDLLSDNSNLLSQFNDLLNRLNNSLLEFLDLSNFLLWMETRQSWSSEKGQLSLDETERSVARFKGFLGRGGRTVHSVTDMLDGGGLFHDFVDLSLFFFRMSTSEDWFHNLISLDSDVMKFSGLLLDDLSDDSDSLNKFLNSLLENGNLLDSGLFDGRSWSLSNNSLEMSDLSSDNSDLLNNLSDDSLLGNNNLLDGLDGLLLGWSKDGDWLSSDDVDLLLDLSDGLSDVDNLGGQILDNLSVLDDLLLDNRLLGWLSLSLSDKSLDSSLDDNSLGNKFVDSGGQFLDNLSEFNNLLLNRFWSEAHLSWSLELLTVMNDRLISVVTSRFLTVNQINLRLKGSE